MRDSTLNGVSWDQWGQESEHWDHRVLAEGHGTTPDNPPCRAQSPAGYASELPTASSSRPGYCLPASMGSWRIGVTTPQPPKIPPAPWSWLGLCCRTCWRQAAKRGCEMWPRQRAGRQGHVRAAAGLGLSPGSAARKYLVKPGLGPWPPSLTGGCSDADMRLPFALLLRWPRGQGERTGLLEQVFI